MVTITADMAMITANTATITDTQNQFPKRTQRTSRTLKMKTKRKKSKKKIILKKVRKLKKARSKRRTLPLCYSIQAAIERPLSRL